jgi:hypothetical protein
MTWELGFDIKNIFNIGVRGYGHYTASMGVSHGII